MLGKLKNIFEAQKKMNDIKKGLEKVIIDHETAQGQIKITMSGTQRVIAVVINEALLVADKKERLEKELVNGINAASDKVQKVAAEQLKSVMGDLKIPGM
ncbi:MAG: YbaB/EbfC family nucleoid-associated protein [Candidatus Omnitrophica bacterium]|nr:YbaB/EbfC family nucleoid-associated protein [Candidatus Omnitrophota bacterium]